MASSYRGNGISSNPKRVFTKDYGTGCIRNVDQYYGILQNHDAGVGKQPVGQNHNLNERSSLSQCIVSLKATKKSDKSVFLSNFADAGRVCQQLQAAALYKHRLHAVRFKCTRASSKKVEFCNSRVLHLKNMLFRHLKYIRRSLWLILISGFPRRE
eukprot:Mrub_05083.p1 GENE.Mrub_05083~~Mrub_05083.p1  ORF type:complete len:156 (-),score=9.25 Mrub_05083:174-641(-)